MIGPVQYQVLAVLLPYSVQLPVQLPQQVNQRGTQFAFLLHGLLAVAAEVQVAFADLSARTDKDTAEELEVNTAVDLLDKFPVGQSRITLEYH